MSKKNNMIQTTSAHIWSKPTDGFETMIDALGKRNADLEASAENAK